MSINIYQLLVIWSVSNCQKFYFLVDIANLNIRKFNYSHLVVANDLFDYLPALMIAVSFICWNIIMVQSCMFPVFWQLNLICILLFIDINLTFMLGIYNYL